MAVCVALTAITAIVASGCGGSDAASTEPSKPATPTTTAAATATATAPPPVEPSKALVLVPSAAGVIPQPNSVVVRVGGHAITEAVFSRAFAAELKRRGPESVIPAPPKFAACIALLKATPAGSTPSSPASGASTPKKECSQIYNKLEAEALDSLILAQWTIDGAAEAGVSVSGDEVQAEVKKDEGSEPQSKFEADLRASRRTLADFELQIKVQLSAEAIRHVITKRTEHITEAQVASYYDHNKAAFGIPERRELEIVHAGTKAEALQAKREIASGKSFASVAKKLRVPQPIYSSNGLVPAYAPGMYEEPPLNNAIFAAKPNVLSGPVKIFLGYYVFEVKRIFPAQQKTLAQSRAAIRQELPGILSTEGLAAFIKHWRRHWTALTDCLPGYIAPKCKQAKRAPGGPPEDPTAFN